MTLPGFGVDVLHTCQQMVGLAEGIAKGTGSGIDIVTRHIFLDVHPAFRLFVDGVVNEEFEHCSVLRTAALDYNEHLIAFVHLLLAVHLHHRLLDRNGGEKRVENFAPHSSIRTYHGGVLRLSGGPGFLFKPYLQIVPWQECGRKDIAHLSCAVRTKADATVTDLQALATRLVDVDHIVFSVIEIV